jgi:hypothetical protein
MSDLREAFEQAKKREREKEFERAIEKRGISNVRVLTPRPKAPQTERCTGCWFFKPCRCGRAPTWEETESSGV